MQRLWPKSEDEKKRPLHSRDPGRQHLLIPGLWSKALDHSGVCEQINVQRWLMLHSHTSYRWQSLSWPLEQKIYGVIIQSRYVTGHTKQSNLRHLLYHRSQWEGVSRGAELNWKSFIIHFGHRRISVNVGELNTHPCGVPITCSKHLTHSLVQNLRTSLQPIIHTFQIIMKMQSELLCKQLHTDAHTPSKSIDVPFHDFLPNI